MLVQFTMLGGYMYVFVCVCVKLYSIPCELTTTKKNPYDRKNYEVSTVKTTELQRRHSVSSIYS